MDKYERVAREIVEHVGGADNIENAYHCMTRLRLNTRDRDKVNAEGIKAINGVMGLVDAPGELQIIIGPRVEDAYNHLLRITGLRRESAIDEDLDPGLMEEKSFNIKELPDKVLGAITASFSPCVPLFVAMGMFNVITAIVGPAMLGILPEDADLYTNFYYLGQAIIYFMMVFVAYAASNYFHTNTMVSMLLAVALLYPDLVAALAREGGYSVYGIPVPNVDYSSQLIPALLIVWVQSYVERGLKRIVPEALDILLVPFGTIAIMFPIALCVLGPLGYYIGSLFGQFLVWLYEVAGPIETLIVSALMPYLTALGIGRPIFFIALTTLTTSGVEYSYMPFALAVSNFVVAGVCLGYVIRTRAPKQRQYGLASFVSLVLGGVSEPTLFGIMLPNPKTIVPTLIGGAVAGLLCGILNVGAYVFGPSNVLSVMTFIGGDGMTNFIYGVIACAIAFAVSFIAMLVLYRSEDAETAADALKASA